MKHEMGLVSEGKVLSFKDMEARTGVPPSLLEGWPAYAGKASAGSG